MKKRKSKPHLPSGAPMAVDGQPAAVAPARAGAAPAGSRPVGVGMAESEPTVHRGTPLPILVIVMFAVMLYLGNLYFTSNSGQLDPRVYYPYRSVKQLEALQPKSDSDAMYAEGRRVYNYICVQCHQPSGQGNPAMFIPPLVGSEWVLAQEPGRLIRIVYKGLTGPIKVKGDTYGQAAMFAVGDQLPGNEDDKLKQVAAVLTYIRNTWDNKAPPVTIERVKASHEKFKDRTDPWTADELLAIPETE